MSKNVVFLFSGQGSQYYNMGMELYNNNLSFQKWMKKLDKVVIELTGTSVVTELYENGRKKSDVFDCLQYTHPAIFMVEYSLAQVLLEKGIYPDHVLGTSMGEFASSVIAGVMSCEDAIICLVKQASILKEKCPDGGMLSIIYNSSLYEDKSLIQENSELAAVNFNSNFVVSGKKENLLKIVKYLKDNGISSQMLPVSVAFHSSIIDTAAPIYKEFLKGMIFKRPFINFVSCMKGGNMEEFESGYFWDIVRKPIMFPQAQRYLSSKGSDYIFIDLGPSGTLGTFTKYLLGAENESEIFPVLTPFGNGVRNLNLLLDSLL